MGKIKKKKKKTFLFVLGSLKRKKQNTVDVASRPLASIGQCQRASGSNAGKSRSNFSICQARDPYRLLEGKAGGKADARPTG